jgi:predicted ATPase/class 3 adenylate cyclase
MGDSAPITFLFTDLVGSTALWEADAPAMSEALARYDEHARLAVTRAGGDVFKHSGDGTCATFERPIDAVRAAIALQGKLADDPELSLRIGIHVGHAERRDGDWFGPTLNRCARIMSVCHGGQILVSDATASLVRPQLTDGVGVIRIGTIRLDGLVDPEVVHQVTAPGLPTAFPALRGQRADVLPRPRTSFVGRTREMAELTRILSAERMVTLTGAGGAGKTRLSIEWARVVAPDFPDGVMFVPLAEVHDAVDVPRAFAEVAGIVGTGYEHPDGDGMAAVLRGLEHRTTALVVDNCEHLLEPARRAIDAILDGCPSVKVIATSREPVGVDGEQVYRVPPLDPGSGTALVVDRATAHDAGYSMSDLERPRAEEMCRRLDGLPLAIELAAARLRTMSLDEILHRLDDRLSLLGGSRSRGRQATLRAALEWSYDLLTPEERCLLDRLSVFVGGFTLTGAERVCGTAPLTPSVVLDVLEALVDKSLVVADRRSDVSRYRLLESVRLYASEQLDSNGDLARFRDRHAAWLRELAVPYMLSRIDGRPPNTGEFFAEVDNGRAAHSWAVERGAADSACLLATAVMMALTFQGGARESVRRCEEALRLGGGHRAPRCACEIAAARAAQFAYDAECAWRHALAARDLLPLDSDQTAWVWNTVAMAALTAPAGTEPSFDECLAEARSHDPDGDAFLDFLEGLHRLHDGHFEDAIDLFERAERKEGVDEGKRQPASLPIWHAACGVNLALARFLGRGETQLDIGMIDEVQRVGDVVLLSELRRVQVVTAAARRDPFDDLLDESLRAVRDAGLPIGMWLDFSAAAAWYAGDHAVAVQLWGARGDGEAWTGELGPHLQRLARATLGDSEYDRLHALGISTSQDQAVDLGLHAH